MNNKNASTKFDRFFLIGLGLLIAVVLVVVFLGPQLSSSPPPPTSEPDDPSGHTETMTARVLEVLEQGTMDLGEGAAYPYQRLLLHIESGSLAGSEIEVEEGTFNVVSQQRRFYPGDRVYLERMVGPYGDRFYISDFVRTWPLTGVAVLFVSLVLLVGRGRGARSLLGTGFSLTVIFAFILPQIKAGHDPVTVSIIGSIVLLAVSTYLVYGWNFKAHAAVIGMMLSLVLTGLLAWAFVGLVRLSGMGMEESAFLVTELGADFDLRGLVLGGIIIGSLGVLDDICIGQSSAIFELVNANRSLDWLALFQRSLNIGRDHIAAMVNTLLLAYVGASMPLMLAFSIYQEPILRRISREPIAEEIVRTLVGSMGLVLAVPLTSLIASLLARWAVRRENQ